MFFEILILDFSNWSFYGGGDDIIPTQHYVQLNIFDLFIF